MKPGRAESRWPGRAQAIQVSPPPPPAGARAVPGPAAPGANAAAARLRAAAPGPAGPRPGPAVRGSRLDHARAGRCIMVPPGAGRPSCRTAPPGPAARQGPRSGSPPRRRARRTLRRCPPGHATRFRQATLRPVPGAGRDPGRQRVVAAGVRLSGGLAGLAADAATWSSRRAPSYLAIPAPSAGPGRRRARSGPGRRRSPLTCFLGPRLRSPFLRQQAVQPLGLSRSIFSGLDIGRSRCEIIEVAARRHRRYQPADDAVRVVLGATRCSMAITQDRDGWVEGRAAFGRGPGSARSGADASGAVDPCGPLTSSARAWASTMGSLSTYTTRAPGRPTGPPHGCCWRWGSRCRCPGTGGPGLAGQVAHAAGQESAVARTPGRPVGRPAGPPRPPPGRPGSYPAAQPVVVHPGECATLVSKSAGWPGRAGRDALSHSPVTRSALPRSSVSTAGMARRCRPQPRLYRACGAPWSRTQAEPEPVQGAQPEATAAVLLGPRGPARKRVSWMTAERAGLGRERDRLAAHHGQRGPSVCSPPSRSSMTLPPNREAPTPSPV